MTLNELTEQCAMNGFEWAEGEHEGKPGVFVRVPRLDTPGETSEGIHVTLEALPSVPWDKVKRAAIGGRDVSHFSRIVGYMSRVDN